VLSELNFIQYTKIYDVKRKTKNKL
jgi:hypothetical protein